MKQIATLLLLFVLFSCRKEVTNQNINPNKEVYLKSFKVQESGDYLLYKPIYDANNKVTKIELWDNRSAGAAPTLSKVLNLSWPTPTQFKISIQDIANSNNANSYIYTIPTATIEQNRMPTEVLYKEGNVTKQRYEMVCPVGSSYITSVKRFNVTTSPITLEYESSSTMSPDGRQVTVDESHRFSGGVYENSRRKYTLGNVINKNINTCRELFWVLSLWSYDELEDAAISPYWQNLSLPTSMEHFYKVGNVWQSNGPAISYPTSFQTNIGYNQYLKKIALPAPNPDGVFQEWEWEVR